MQPLEMSMRTDTRLGSVRASRVRLERTEQAESSLVTSSCLALNGSPSLKPVCRLTRNQTE